MKNNNILLINPWIYDFAAYDFWIKPVGLLSIASILKQCGYQLSLIDCLDRFHPLQHQLKKEIKIKHKKYGTGKFYRERVDKPHVLRHIPRQFCRYGIHLDVFLSALSSVPTPNVVLITSGMTYWYPGPFKAIEIIRKKFPKTPIVLGGIYATLNHEHAVKNSGADYVIKGPGEFVALRLVDELTGNQADYSALPQRWAEMPEPTYEHYSVLKSLPIMTSRGCPYRCSFCASQLLWDTFEQKAPQQVVDFIEHYYRKRRVHHFAFFDDALLINHKFHLSKILEAVIEKGLDVTFHTPNGMQPKEIDVDLADLMFRANFKTIRLSYETANKKRQQEMQHKVSDEALSNALDALEKAGYDRKQIGVYVIMGLPGQSIEEVVESMIFVASLGAKISLSSYSPIPATLDWERAVNTYHFSSAADPLLTNNSIYPLLDADKIYDQFQQVHHLSKFLNTGLDLGVNIFNTSPLGEMVWNVVKKNNFRKC